MWKDIGLLGRDKLLKNELLPRALGRKPPFLLAGQRGVGKTALLEWAFEHDHSQAKALISAGHPVRETLQHVVKSWGIEAAVQREGKAVPLARSAIADLERAIMSQTSGTLYIDDIQAATPTFLRRLKVWRERFVVHVAGVPPFTREDLRRTLWGLKELEVTPIPRNERERLAKATCRLVGSRDSPREIAQASRGCPARILAMARGEIEETAPRVEGEELNVAPVLLLGLGGIIALRYIGMGLDETDLYLMGGIGMGLAVFGQFFLYRGIAKR